MTALLKTLSLAVWLPFLTGCVVTGDYVSQAEARGAADARSNELAQIRALGGDYKKLWNDSVAFEKWKQLAVPVLKETGVTKADLYHRGSVTTSVTGSIEDDWSEVLYLEKEVYGIYPQPKPRYVSAGLYQIPGRFEVAEDTEGVSVRSSRGNCTVGGVPTTIYAYDFFGLDRDYFLRCEFWVTEHDQNRNTTPTANTGRLATASPSPAT